MAQLPQNCYAGACSGGSFCMQNIRRLGLRARVNCSIQTTVVLAESSIPATLVRKLLLSWICPCRAVQNSTEHNTKFFLQLRLILTLKSELSVSVSWKTVRIYPLWLEGGGGRSRREKDWKYRLDSGSINVFIAKETGALNSSLLAYQRQHYPRRSKSNRSKPLLPRDWTAHFLDIIEFVEIEYRTFLREHQPEMVEIREQHLSLDNKKPFLWPNPTRDTPKDRSESEEDNWIPCKKPTATCIAQWA